MLSPAPQIRYHAAQDGYRFVTRVWEIENSVANVVYLHGIASHGGWYLSSCAHLAREGLGVHFQDRRGSGLNPDARGDVEDWKTWLTDVESYLARLPRQPPRILLGISWGGILAAAIARHRPALLSGIGLLCPGLCSKKAANLAQRSALRLAGLLGLNSLRVTIPLRDPALFTNSEKGRSYIAGDPFTLRKITIRAALANLVLTRYATESPEEIRVPTLLMIAGRDPITDNPRIRQYIQRISHENKRVIEYREASHTLEFEADPSPYFHDLAAWCREVAKGTSSS